MMKLKIFAIIAVLLGEACAKIFFQETFEKNTLGTVWHPSKAKENGKFEWTCGKFCVNPTLKGIKTSQDAKFYALSAKFEPFSNLNQILVIQYTVRHEQDLDCGGGYIKLMSSSINSDSFGSKTPFYIMFGPDICGPERKIHVILSHEGVEKERKFTIPAPADNLNHLYTLVIDQKDKSYKVSVDDEVLAQGLIVNDWNILPSKTIKDPSAKKPFDWEDDEMIPDKSAKKPIDWDDEPEFIEDVQAKPTDWDDDLDGVWTAKKILNPKYRGKWNAPLVKNPKYKGLWIHPEIPNPEYKGDDNVALYKDIGAVGFDLWQVRSGSLFSNIIISNNESEAKEFADRTWKAWKDKEYTLVAGINQQQDSQDELHRDL